MSALAPVVVTFILHRFPKPELAKLAEADLNWIMDSDDTKSVSSLTKVLRQVKSQISNSLQVKMMITNMLKTGLGEKN